MRDRKMQKHQSSNRNSGTENAGLENTGPQLIKKAKMQRGCLHSMLILGPVDYVSVRAL